MISNWWIELNRKFPTVETDEHVVMPNHLHGIILIHNDLVGADPCVCPDPKQGATRVRPYIPLYNGLKP